MLIYQTLLVLGVKLFSARHLLVESLVQLLNELLMLRLKLLYLALEIFFGILESVSFVLGRLIFDLLNALCRRLVKIVYFVLVLFLNLCGSLLMGRSQLSHLAFEFGQLLLLGNQHLFTLQGVGRPHLFYLGFQLSNFLAQFILHELFVASCLFPKLIQHLLILASQIFNFFLVTLSKVFLKLVVFPGSLLLEITELLLRFSQQFSEVVHGCVATLVSLEKFSCEPLDLSFEFFNLMVHRRYFFVPFLNLVGEDFLILFQHNYFLVPNLQLFPHFLNLAQKFVFSPLARRAHVELLFLQHAFQLIDLRLHVLP